jgi:hypothetical protein
MRDMVFNRAEVAECICVGRGCLGCWTTLPRRMRLGTDVRGLASTLLMRHLLQAQQATGKDVA